MAAKPAGEWQTLDVELVGRHVTVDVNGFAHVDVCLNIDLSLYPWEIVISHLGLFVALFRFL